MKTVELLRVFKRTDGTFGILSVDGFPSCLTVERQWLDNHRGISCIPAGHYLCHRVNSPKFGNTFEITNVPGRSEILFHSGNIDDDSHGCVVLGENFEPWIDGRLSVQSSKIAFSQFMTAMKNQNEFPLLIKEVS